jgi:hypothetical protein
MFPIKSALYVVVVKVENSPEKLDIIVQVDVLLSVLTRGIAKKTIYVKHFYVDSIFYRGPRFPPISLQTFFAVWLNCDRALT